MPNARFRAYLSKYEEILSHEYGVGGVVGATPALERYIGCFISKY